MILDHEHCEDSRDIILKKQSGPLQRIKSTHQAYDALSYPLLFPHGQAGWDPSLLRNQGASHAKITLMDYNKFYFQCREETNILHHAGRLFQQYAVDCYARIEQERIGFLRFNQKRIRADFYQGIEDRILSNGEGRIGKRIILPSSHIGSPRNMQGNYLDAMAIVRAFGKPDLFVTMTCNPKWEDITGNLLEGNNLFYYRSNRTRQTRYCRQSFQSEIKKTY